MNRIKNRPLSLLLCLALLLNCSYMPYASAQESPNEPPPDSSSVQISKSAILKIGDVQTLDTPSIDITPTKQKVGLKERKLSEKTMTGKGISIGTADNSSLISNLEVKPARVKKSKWRKKSISLAMSPKDLLKTSESKELKKLA